MKSGAEYKIAEELKKTRQIKRPVSLICNNKSNTVVGCLPPSSTSISSPPPRLWLDDVSLTVVGSQPALPASSQNKRCVGGKKVTPHLQPSLFLYSLIHSFLPCDKLQIHPSPTTISARFIDREASTLLSERISQLREAVHSKEQSNKHGKGNIVVL